ncbi:MAG: hypothetical protein QXN71_03000 [Candidatus Aenigmatarchaeota archaeon]
MEVPKELLRQVGKVNNNNVNCHKAKVKWKFRRNFSVKSER